MRRCLQRELRLQRRHLSSLLAESRRKRRYDKWAEATTSRPLYLVGGRRIDCAGATDRLRPWSKKTARSCRVVAPLFWQRARTVARASPRQTGREPASARTGHKTKEVPRMVPERTEAYAGVDVSKERLEVCVRRG